MIKLYLMAVATGISVVFIYCLLVETRTDKEGGTAEFGKNRTLS
ncbi:TPA: hypothetical protein ACGR23_004686 [Escherichia coli]|nr:hypothetical protein [Escherichia coli]